jgi:hypothetical protein
VPPVRLTLNTPGVRLVASGCDATTVTVADGGGGAFVTVIVWLALLVWPPLPLTVSDALKVPALV